MKMTAAAIITMTITTHLALSRLQQRAGVHSQQVYEDLCWTEAKDVQAMSVIAHSLNTK